MLSIVFDFDTVVLDPETTGNEDTKTYMQGALPLRGLVYALRHLEQEGIGYAFYSRQSKEKDGDFISFAEKRLFRFMPTCSCFAGMVHDVPIKADVVVTSDDFLAQTAMIPVIFMGKKRRSLKGVPYRLMDCYSQLPSVFEDMRIRRA
jgi:hypothetical protein